MNQRSINLFSIQSVAFGLGELLPRMAFVGGAVLDFYANDPKAAAPRPTMDIDLVVELASFSEWAVLQERLAALGFSPDPSSKIACRYRFGDFTVDIMGSSDDHFGPANPWFKPAFSRLETVEIGSGLSIQVLPFAYLLATKFSAFIGRGNGDPRTSHDFEDIIYLTNNRLDFAEEIMGEPDAALKLFLKKNCSAIFQSRYREEWVGVHLAYADRSRLAHVLEKIGAVAGMG